MNESDCKKGIEMSSPKTSKDVILLGRIELQDEEGETGRGCQRSERVNRTKVFLICLIPYHESIRMRPYEQSSAHLF